MTEQTKTEPTIPELLEQWRPIIGYEGFYEVSDHGRIRRGERVLKPQPYAGYMRCGLTRNGKTATVLVHQVVTVAFLGACPKGNQVNHLNLNRADNRLVNLEYVTPSDNIRHAYKHSPEYLANHRKAQKSKLTVSDVRAIRSRVSSGETFKQIAPSMGVTKEMIWRIATRRSWGWVQ